MQQSKEEATCLKEKLSQKLPQPLKILAAAFKIYDMFDVKTSGSQPDIWVSQDDASDIRYATLKSSYT